MSVRAVTRAAAILRAFAPTTPELTLTEVAEAADLDVGTARRLLLTLLDCGLVAQKASSLRYCLGRAVVELSRAVPDDQDLRQIASPFIGRLAQQTGATIFLAVEAGGKAVCLERLFGHKAVVQVRWWTVGQGVDLTVGAAPRVLLAGQPDERIKTLLRAKVPKLTPRSVTKAAAIRREIREIRERGWTLSVEEAVEGISATAAPVLDRNGSIIAAVSVAGLKSQILPNGKPRWLPALLECTKGISARLQ